MIQQIQKKNSGIMMFIIFFIICAVGSSEVTSEVILWERNIVIATTIGNIRKGSGNVRSSHRKLGFIPMSCTTVGPSGNSRSTGFAPTLTAAIMKTKIGI